MKSNLRRIVFLWGMLFLAALACGKTPVAPPPSPPAPTGVSLPVGDSEHTLVYAGLERSYVLHIPPGYESSHPAALVLAFHGITLDAYEMMRISGFDAQSDAAGFIVAYPNASGEQKSWNGGHCCGQAARDNVDDVGFVRAVIAELSASLNIDPKRIYATGFSNGAILTYRLGCEMADQIAAIAPVSATPAREDWEACQPSRPLPVIHFHGTEDEPNPYNGGVTPGGVQFVSVEEAIRFWVDFDGCPSEATHYRKKEWRANRRLLQPPRYGCATPLCPADYRRSNQAIHPGHPDSHGFLWCNHFS